MVSPCPENGCCTHLPQAVFCFACCLFREGDGQFPFQSGYNDWKHATRCFAEHENSDGHRKAMFNYINRAAADGVIDLKSSSSRTAIIGVKFCEEWLQLYNFWQNGDWLSEAQVKYLVELTMGITWASWS